MKKTSLIIFLCLFIAAACLLNSAQGMDIENQTRKAKKPLMLLNQNGESIEIDSLMGKFLVITFIYTRCPSPTKCPLIMSRMVKLQKELVDYKDDVNFAIVSIDPEYDTPRVLKEYAEIHGADFSNFTLLTGPKEKIDKVIKRFKIYVDEEEPGILSHSLDTFLLDSKGVIRRIFPGAFWEVEVAADKVIELIEGEQAAEVQGGTLQLE